jgi:hypothetical protein
VAYSCSAVASIVAIFLGVGRLYPAVKARIVKLREAGIKPTLMRIIFIEKALASNLSTRLISAPDLHSEDASVVVVAQSPAALLLLTPNQIGSMVATHTVRVSPSLPPLTLLQVAAIGPAYAGYRQIIIDNKLTGKYVAGEAHDAMAAALADIGISKKVHVSSIVEALMLLKSGDEDALAAAASHPSS